MPVTIEEARAVLSTVGGIRVDDPFEYLLNQYMNYFKRSWMYSRKKKIKFWIETINIVCPLMDDWIAGSLPIASCLELLVRKNTGYSNRPLTMLGTKGIACRCVSKVCRIQNLIIEEDSSKRDSESIGDNLKDLFNYGILSVLKLEGKLK